jgi:photolyase PhrII
MNIDLPAPLAERVEWLTEAPLRAEGEFVLYWAHHALRAHDNPALQTAAALATEAGLPLLVYQGLGGRHRYNSDRHHRFILEAARDFSSELAGLGLKLLFNLSADPGRKGPLGDLLARSAAVVSELYPVPPFTDWYPRHAAAHPGLPFLLVDASCILPMPVSATAPTRAFQFRKRYRAELDARVAVGWTGPESWPEAFDGDPGFEPFDLSASLSEAIAGCRIDHSVPPVAATPGGSQAGYRRWSQFLETGLGRYHRLRNDASLPDAVSRLSPYLHYGCVSPFRVAGEAMQTGGEGADKFLDELLIWRELSHHFCYRSKDLESLDALPDWARRSLLEHRADIRTETFDWEALIRGRSGNTLWDLAQRSLLRRGELHNNLRMTWGKAFLPWAQEPSRALRLMIDLNHRFALDGSDPNSYGGLLWCLGQFDRAFPPGPVFGKVRQRSIARHAARLDLDRYAHFVSLPAGGRRLRVAVVGAGLAGLTAARVLSDQGHEVVVVEKARGPGGRMSTRRAGDYRFDHGAQYFTARDPRFQRHVLAWRERGLVESWDARIATVGPAPEKGRQAETQRFVAVPGMNAVCAEMASELSDCRFGWRLESAACDDGTWRLEADNGEHLAADALVLTAPPDQAGPLLGDREISRVLDTIDMQPCWAVMAVFDRPLFADWDAAFVNEGPLSWVSGQANRPGRPSAQAWVLHASPEWSKEHLEDEAEEVVEALLGAAGDLPIARSVTAEWTAAHRWRYALAARPLDSGALWFPDRRLALAGDWCHGSRIEGAFLSGAAAAGRVMGAEFARA